MSFSLSFFLFLIRGVWSIYATLLKDYFTGVPNAIGLVLCSAQLIVYVVYRRKRQSPKNIDREGSAQLVDVEKQEWDTETHQRKHLNKVKSLPKQKASGRIPEDYEKLGDKIGATILRNYSHILASCNALDYPDFISSSVKLLSDIPKVYQECLGIWKAILVDEFQDTSSMQYCLLRILSSHGHVTIVGEEDQSIYSFNGADICGFNSFREDFPTHKEIRLTKNYRSIGCIVAAASSLIYNNDVPSFLKCYL